MRTPSPSEIAAARIPKITDLRDELCYGDVRLARCTAFADDLRVFRRRYSSMGFHGPDLLDWKSSKHQDALRQMTASFLDEYGYGEVYWPSDPNSPNFNSLQYSKDRTFITRTVRQLIFRLNLQQYRNNKYKKKEQHSSREIHEIVDLEAEESTKNLPKPTFRSYNSEIPSNPSTSNALAADDTTIPSTEILENFTVADSVRWPFRVDAYDEPSSSGSESETPELRPVKRKMDAHRKDKPAKRSKIISSKFPIDKASNLGPEQTAPKATWSSPRRGRTMQRPNHVYVNDLDQASALQPVTTESTLDHNDDIRGSHRTSTNQDSEHIEDVLNYIRTNRPSRTSTSITPTPVIRKMKSTCETHIDPNLEKMVYSTTHQRKPARASSSSSVMINPSSRAPPDNKSAPSPTPTNSTLGPTHETIQKPSAPLMPLPVSQGAPKPSDQDSNPQPTASPNLVSTSNASIEFSYIVLLSRAPIYQYKTWKPRGHFLEKSLSELVTELPFDNKKDIKALTIRLEGPGVAVEETLNCEEDAKFNTTKSRFLRIVKMCVKNHNKAKTGGVLVMSFEFEAVREDDAEEEDNDDDDIVF